jgi:hypothetical protein
MRQSKTKTIDFCSFASNCLSEPVTKSQPTCKHPVILYASEIILHALPYINGVVNAILLLAETRNGTDHILMAFLPRVRLQ